jgi:poly(A) polymerase
MARHDDDPEQTAQRSLERMRRVTRGTPYEGHLYLVGGLLRDRALGLPLANDLDLVLEGDALELARFLYEHGLSSHYPVLYPRFGTAMIHIGNPEEAGSAVELVSARAESYQPDSRKPDVRRSTIHDDVLRRDFTINTLLENLHTGELLDLTGRAFADLRAGVLRTPLAPRLTFFDDPLRMLRAVRFAARFGFTIEAETWQAICAEASRLRPPTIAYERIREEFVKIAKLPGDKFRHGMELLLESNLLAEFLPEMLPMIGCTQGDWHRYDVWTHTLTALESLPDAAAHDTARLEVRLALLWHDIGKPPTRSVAVPTSEPALPFADASHGMGASPPSFETVPKTAEESVGAVRFYGHPAVGAEMVRTIMNRLKFSNEEIRDVTVLVNKHMRLGEYRHEWSDVPVKRLIRDCGAYLDDLFALTRCDRSAVDIPPDQLADIDELRTRIDALNALSDIAHMESPLNGNTIMEVLKIGPGPQLKAAKEFLLNEIIEGRLSEKDRDAARRLLRAWWQDQSSQ